MIRYGNELYDNIKSTLRTHEVILSSYIRSDFIKCLILNRSSPSNIPLNEENLHTYVEALEIKSLFF